MGCNSAYFKLGDQLLQSPPHLFLCNTGQRESQGSVLPQRTTTTLLTTARGQAGSTPREGDTGQPPGQCQQQQGCPLEGRRELPGTHGMLPPPQEPALLERHWELGHSTGSITFLSRTSLPQLAREETRSARRQHCPRKIHFQAEFPG